jgi:transketolase
MRLHRKSVEEIYAEDEEFELGKGKVLREGGDVSIIATGAIMVSQALKAAQLLVSEGIEATVIDMHTIKPIDKELVLKYARKTGAIVTCENHQIVNGLGSAVAEVLSENYPVKLKRIGVNEQFGEVGTLEELIARFRFTPEDIASDVKQFLKK